MAWRTPYAENATIAGNAMGRINLVSILRAGLLEINREAAKAFAEPHAGRHARSCAGFRPAGSFVAIAVGIE
jgi:hypothetical protein